MHLEFSIHRDLSVANGGEKMSKGRIRRKRETKKGCAANKAQVLFCQSVESVSNCRHFNSLLIHLQVEPSNSNSSQRMTTRKNYLDEETGGERSSGSDFYAATNLPTYTYQEQQPSTYNQFTGVGAGTNAYRPSSPTADLEVMDTPSMYTDPFESRSTAPPPNINSTRPRPPSTFLNSDPYYDSKNPNTGLSRSDTIGPHDSVSSYNVPYVAPNTAYDQDYNHNTTGITTNHTPGYSYSYDQDDPDETINDPQNRNSYYDPSSNSLPLKYNAGGMGYAENEDDEAYQMNDKSRGGGGHFRDDSRSTVGGGIGMGPGLFTNQTGPTPEMGLGRYSNKDPDPEATRGLLGKIKGGSLEEQIEKRRKGIGRQRWPILSWILG